MEEKPTLASIAEYLAIVAICLLVVIVLWHVYIIVRDTVFGEPLHEDKCWLERYFFQKK